MANVPKFQACGQRWSDMTPVQGGRMCDECNNKVVDLTRKRWKQIEQLHSEQPGICGMYTPKQVQHWGHDIPSNSVCSKVFTITSIMLALAGVPFTSQSQTVIEVEVKFDCDEPTDSIKALPPQPTPAVEEKKSTIAQTPDSSGCTVLKGYVRDKDTGFPIGFTPVVVISNASQLAGNYSDENGYFEIDVTGRIDEKSELVIKTSYLGYNPVEVQFGRSCFKKTTEINLTLTKAVSGIIVGLLVSERPLMQTAGQKVVNVLHRFKY